MTDAEKLLLLQALQETGVDNWEGYEEALELFEQLKAEAEIEW